MSERVKTGREERAIRTVLLPYGRLGSARHILSEGRVIVVLTWPQGSCKSEIIVFCELTP